MYLYLLHEVQSLHKFEMTKDMTFQQKVTWRTFAFLFCEMQSFVVNRQTERGWKLRAVENLFKILLFWAEPAEHRIDFTMGETIKGHRNDEMTNWTTMPSFISRFRRRKVNAHWYKSVKSGKNGKLTYQKSEKEKTWKITEKRGLKDLSSVRIWAHSSLPETIIFQFGQLDYIGGKWIKSLQLLKLPSCRVFASNGSWCRGGGGGNLRREVHSMVSGWYSWSTRIAAAGGEINWNPIQCRAVYFSVYIIISAGVDSLQVENWIALMTS